MPWYCSGCGQRRGGTLCKKWCQEKYGSMGAERIPPLDGIIYINDDGSGIPRYELMKQRESAVKYVPRSIQGPRPQGWEAALREMAKRGAKVLSSGLSIPEC